MLTALLIVGSILMTVLVVGFVLIAVFVCRALQESNLIHERAHQRWVKQLEKVQDKLLAHNWEEYVGIRTLEDESVGGFSEPGEQEGDIEQLVPGLFGGLTTSPPIARPDAETEILLAEDFDDSGEPVRRIPG